MINPLTSDIWCFSNSTLISSIDTATASASSSPAHHTNAKPIGRTLVGVLSGAAANIRSKFTNLSHHQTHGTDGSSSVYQVNQSPSRMKGNGPRSSGGTSGVGGGVLPHPTQSPQTLRDYEDIRRVHNGGLEQSPQSIPITVPGAEGPGRNGNYGKLRFFKLYFPFK